VLPLAHFGATSDVFALTAAAWCGTITIMGAGEGSRSTQQYDLKAHHASLVMHLLVAGKAHHRSGTFHSRHIGVSKGRLHI
jgi:hypothetical protein